MSEKDKKKKLTLTVSSKKPQVRVPNYSHSKGKTSVVIEKKPSRKWGGKNFSQKITLINLNYHLIFHLRNQLQIKVLI